MDLDRLQTQLRLFDPDLAIEEAWLPPSSWYTVPEVYDVERATVFQNAWLVAARADQLQNPGDFVSGVVAGEPYLVVRGEDGTLRAFYNVCRHHAAGVMVGEGCAEELVCPYHGWTYALDGRLTRAPELGAVRSFDRDAFGLFPMQAEQWGPLVFVSPGEGVPDFGAGMDDLLARLDSMRTGDLVFAERRTWTIACNWKVFVDNYLDGGYHVSYLHKGLAGQLDLSTYRTEIYEKFSIQSAAGASDEPPRTPIQRGSDFRERVGDRVLYAWLYPTLMINRYGPMMDINWVLPRGHDETEVVMDYYFETTDGPGAHEFIAESLAASNVVQKEDIEICESVQRGLESNRYDRGRYSVRREAGEHHFHRLLAADLRLWKP